MMKTQADPFIEIAIMLAKVRRQDKTKQRFPQELWDAIIGLAKAYPIQEVSHRLNIPLSYLKRKIQESHQISPLDFKEIVIQNDRSEMVSVELFSDFGVRAKIQGPPSCLGYLSTLFVR